MPRNPYDVSFLRDHKVGEILAKFVKQLQQWSDTNQKVLNNKSNLLGNFYSFIIFNTEIICKNSFI